MSVNELVEKMGMSYMGIKQHCITLHRDGYLDTWRRPQRMGRPEMVYRPYPPHARSFSGRESSVYIGFVESGGGHLRTERAGEVALITFSKKKTAALKAKAKGDTVADRAKWLAHVRDGEGYMAEFVNNSNRWWSLHPGVSLPILNVLERYPIVGRFEQDMFEAVLSTRVRPGGHS